MAKDIKVIFRGNRSPSGKSNNVEYFIGKSRLEKLKKDGIFDIEVLEEPKSTPIAPASFFLNIPPPHLDFLLP